ncbi:MAG TPA: hypothetical protein VFR10_01415, partial [bacterium]|nr:hypothetical protein [bacterium]
CLRSALPTIVSDLGNAREYWDDSVRAIPVRAGEEEIAQQIVEILTRPALMKKLSEGAYQYAQRSGFRQAALSLLAAITPTSIETGHTRDNSTVPRLASS